MTAQTTAIALLLALGNMPAFAQQAAPFVPSGFTAPVLVKGAGFELVPLGPALVKIDYDAYMSSIAHLQTTFTRSKDWPHAGLTAADAMKDMEGEAGRFQQRQSFAYAVLTPDGRRERGSVYVSPSRVAGYDAVVRLWVTKAEYDAGFDAELYAWVTGWVRKEWPFAKVAYPGRAIPWAEWDALVAASKAAGPN
ncbi:twin-arginine translocation pathway signal protein [Sandarakinorhabdus sp.]|uniref:twin-arginine translocation pathway signal protein n=1 Tax=Sandarakinorhabdus sp. TaxID=1916663 RepID=UPI00333E9F36